MRQAELVAWISAEGAIESIEACRPDPLHHTDKTWPARLVIYWCDAASFRAAAKTCVTWLRIWRPTWLKYLKSRPGAVVMKDVQGRVQMPNRGTVKRPSAAR